MYKTYYQKIKKITNEALEEAKKQKDLFSSDAINWADLSCIDVSINEAGVYIIQIEECAPDAFTLLNFLENEIFEKHGLDVVVFGEW